MKVMFGVQVHIDNIVQYLMNHTLCMVTIILIKLHGLDWRYIIVMIMKEIPKENNAKKDLKLKNISRKL